MAIITAIPIIGNAALVALIIYAVVKITYNLFFHKLKSYPGPLLARASIVYSSYYHLAGKYPIHMSELHKKYGSVVRIRPSELSFASAQAWQDINGVRTGSERLPEFERDFTVLTSSPKAYSIINAPIPDHRRIRRVVSHAFSEKALAAQEPIVQKYITQLVEQFRARAQDPEKSVSDIRSWLNFTTFDVIGDLMYGESFHCVETGAWDPWITFIFDTVKLAEYLKVANRLPKIPRTLGYLIIYYLLPQNSTKHVAKSKTRTENRLKQGITDRNDFVDEIMSHNSDRGMTQDEILASSPILITGGSETTATLLSGAIFLLLKNKSVMTKLCEEVRGSFKSEEEINSKTAANLKYLNAVLQESFRLYPPVPDTLPRVVPEPGHMVDGKFVPGGTAVGVIQYGAYNTPDNFAKPDKFIPERWLGDPEFENDSRAVLQPFSVGARNCIGQRLAWLEMRILLSRLIWNFDFELLPQSSDWMNQRIFVLWEKPPLYVDVSIRK